MTFLVSPSSVVVFLFSSVLQVFSVTKITPTPNNRVFLNLLSLEALAYRGTIFFSFFILLIQNTALILLQWDISAGSIFSPLTPEFTGLVTFQFFSFVFVIFLTLLGGCFFWRAICARCFLGGLSFIFCLVLYLNFLVFLFFFMAESEIFYKTFTFAHSPISAVFFLVVIVLVSSFLHIVFILLTEVVRSFDFFNLSSFFKVFFVLGFVIFLLSFTWFSQYFVFYVLFFFSCAFFLILSVTYFYVFETIIRKSMLFGFIP